MGPMLSFNIYYLDLLGYALLLSAFIPIWVFLMLGCQLFMGSGVMSVGDELNLLEFLWTVIPTLSVALLCWYNIHSSWLPAMGDKYDSVLVVGNQWYWSYSVDNSESTYDSVMLDFVGSVDKPLRLNLHEIYLLLVTSADVIHSFSIPAFGLKLDGIPGRVNEIFFCPDRVGVFVGYCSELCGAGHAYMPIVLEVVKSVKKVA